MIFLAATMIAGCMAMSAADVRDFEKLLRANYRVPPRAQPQVLPNSKDCRRIAGAAGYTGRQVTVIHLDHLYAVINGDELRVLDDKFKVLRSLRRKERQSSRPSNVALQQTSAQSIAVGSLSSTLSVSSRALVEPAACS